MPRREVQLHTAVGVGKLVLGSAELGDATDTMLRKNLQAATLGVQRVGSRSSYLR